MLWQNFARAFFLVLKLLTNWNLPLCPLENFNIENNTYYDINQPTHNISTDRISQLRNWRKCPPMTTNESLNAIKYTRNWDETKSPNVDRPK